MLLLDFITFRHNTGNGAQCATDIEVLSAKFGNGNDKLGKGMGLWTFDLPPIKTCPGSTDAICRESRPYSKQGMEQVCWACRKRYCQPKLQTLREVNYQFSQSDAFVNSNKRQIGCVAAMAGSVLMNLLRDGWNPSRAT